MAKKQIAVTYGVFNKLTNLSEALIRRNAWTETAQYLKSEMSKNPNLDAFLSVVGKRIADQNELIRKYTLELNIGVYPMIGTKDDRHVEQNLLEAEYDPDGDDFDEDDDDPEE